MELLFTNEQFELHYDERHFFYGVLKGYFSKEKLMEACEVFLLHLEATKCGNLISDYRQVKGISMLALPWLGLTFIPHAVSLGFSKVAVIHSVDPFVLQFIKKGLEYSDKYDGQLFSTYPEAENWLLDIEEVSSSGIQWNNGKLLVQKGGKYILIETKELCYLSSHGQGTMLHCKDQVHEVSQPLADFSSSLPMDFFQIHPEHIVNSNQIKSVGRSATGSYAVILMGEDRTELPVCPQYDSQLKKFLEM